MIIQTKVHNGIQRLTVSANGFIKAHFVSRPVYFKKNGAWNSVGAYDIGKMPKPYLPKKPSESVYTLAQWGAKMEAMKSAN